MNKYVVVLALLLLVSCGGSQSSQASTQYVGTEGVTLEFLSRQPPRLVYDNLPFTISVRVTNEGAQNIQSESDPIIVTSNLRSLFYLELPSFI